MPPQTPARAAAEPKRPAQPQIDDLRVTAHMMTLETGLFCVVSLPVAGADAAMGLPGVRLTVAPGPAGRPDAVSIRGFREDGWLTATGDAALVRVAEGPAQIMVTIYQTKGATDGAPNLQVRQLVDPAVPPEGASNPAPAQAAPVAAPTVASEMRKAMDMIAHIQGRGDVGCMLGDWMGEQGSRAWIEGFAVAPTQDVLPADIEYQAVLGRGWLSPWAEGGQFCGSRGMALPVLGLRLRLRGAAAQTHECSYSATFVDGTAIGPVPAGEACEAESLAPLESFQVIIHKRGAAPKPVEMQMAKAPAKPVPAKPVLAKPVLPKPGPAKATPAKATPAKPAGKAAPAKTVTKAAAKPVAKAKPAAKKR